MAAKKRAVLVGCGSISSAWLASPTVRNSVSVVGLVDVRRAAAESKARDHGLSDALISTDLDAALKKTRPDVVFDCTVPEAHCGVTLCALRSGCHVLGEKPLADTMTNARRMVRAARRAGRIYAVMQNRRWDANIRRLRSFLASGRIGRVTTVHSDFFIGAHFGGFRDRMKHVLLLDMAIHTFDAARFISEADATAVYCREWNPAGSWYRHGASAVAVFDMTDGIEYTYRGSWCAEGLRTTWEAQWRVIGEKGTVTWDGADGFRAEAVSSKTGFIRAKSSLRVPARSPKAKTGGHDGAIAEFLRCVRAGREPETICTDNIRSLAMVHAAIESAEKGKRMLVRP